MNLIAIKIEYCNLLCSPIFLKSKKKMLIIAILIIKIINALFLIILGLILTSFIILIDRKVLGAIQRRLAPNVTGFLGILQQFADALKLLKKEWIFPDLADKFLFKWSPVWILCFSLMLLLVLGFANNIAFANFKYSLLYFFIMSSLSVYGLLFAGWSSNSKYPLLGAQRAAAQLISYEIVMGVILTILGLYTKTFNIIKIVELQQTIWLIFPLFPVFFIFFTLMLIETNRHPFDLPEAESELVSGYNVEYSGMLFALFILAEYLKMFAMSIIVVLIFFGGWYIPSLSPITSILCFFILSLKIFFFIFIFSWIRAILPRYRYDQLMKLSWKILYPLSLSLFVFLFGLQIFLKNIYYHSFEILINIDLYYLLNGFFLFFDNISPRSFVFKYLLLSNYNVKLLLLYI